MLPVNDNLTQMGNELTSSGDLLKDDITKQLTFTQDNMTRLKTGINLMAAKYQAPLALNGAQQAIDTLTAGLNEVNTGLKQQGTTTDTMGGIQATAIINDGLKQVQAVLKGTSSQQALVSGLTTLNNSAPTLISGITQLNDGAGKLADGSDQLTSGLSKAGGGIHLLNVKLAGGSKQVYGLSTGKANVNHFVTPVTDQSLKNLQIN